MIFPLKDKWRLTSDFDEMRPYGTVRKTHKHGAWDLAVPISTPIYAPEVGILHYFFQVRTGNIKHHNIYWADGRWYAFSNYFYDSYGALAVLETHDHLTFVFAHIYAKNIIAMTEEQMICLTVDELKTVDGMILAFHNRDKPLGIDKGDIIAYSGNAGYSTGPHIHMELHKGRSWIPHRDRPDPKDIWPEEYKKKGG